MAKKRTMNELRQTKEYKIDPVQQVLAQQIEELAEHDKPSQGFIEDQEAAKQMAEIDRQECELDPVQEAKTLIVEKIVKHLDNVLFEMVNEEMNKSYVFQSEQYLTQAGYDEFEEAWFEFYHEHHGDILYQLKQTVFE